ncbi:cobaltochelatase [Pseudomonas aeruginosa]|nr:cobaltochelatase [Pseudomonas aeruginosa]
MTLLTELLDELHHPAVRDLAWTLLAPPLLRRTPEPQRHPLAASRWRQEPERLAAWCANRSDSRSTSPPGSRSGHGSVSACTTNISGNSPWNKPRTCA